MARILEQAFSRHSHLKDSVINVKALIQSYSTRMFLIMNGTTKEIL
jgi:hypothetical protein